MCPLPQSAAPSRSRETSAPSLAGEAPRDARTPDVLVSRSLSPPAPLGGKDPCGDTEVLALRDCAEDRPAPLTSHPPPGAAVGCYTGTVVDGRYEIGPVLGQGGMGVVYAARHVVIGKRCAVKILRSEVASDPEIAERFLQEARAASSIGNPHIIDISDFGRFPDGTTYFVMEYLEGQPLSGLIKEQGCIAPDRIVHIARQIASGVGAAHARGIVHRDLKPDNIMLTGRSSTPDFVKILDFGIAKVSAGPKVTMAGRLFGTPYYMSPEQAGGGAVDCRTDVYALGVIMYEMASGRVPFDGDTLMGILTQHLYQKPVPPRELVGGAELPPGLEGIILKALAKEPAQRYQTMHELTVDLDLLATGSLPKVKAARAVALTANDSHATHGIALPVAPAPKPRPPRARHAVLASLLLVMGGAGAWRIQSKRHPTSRESPVVAAVSPALALSSSPSASAALPAPDGNEAVANTPAAPAPSGAVSDARTDKPTGTVSVVFAAEPLDAHVFRGRDDLGPTPLTLDVDKRAPQVLDVRAPGYKVTRIKIDGTRPRVTVKLAIAKHRPATNTKKSLDPNGIVNPWAK